MNTKRYLHPITPTQKPRTKDYRTVKAGTTPAGWKLSQFEAVNPGVNGEFRHGIMVEPPGQPARMIFGSPQEIADMAHAIEKNPAKVQQKIRIMGESSFYSLNQPGRGHNKPIRSMPTRMEADNYTRAQKLFPDHDSEHGLRDKVHQEQKEFKEHLIDQARQGVAYADSVDGQKAVARNLDRSIRQGKAMENSTNTNTTATTGGQQNG